MSVLLSFALASTVAAPMLSPLPEREIACDALSQGGLEHREVIRIDRDFGKPEFDLVIDAWTTEQRPDALFDVRLWWVKTTAEDRRSPLSSRARKWVDIDNTEIADNHWRIRVRGDKKEFRFDVELADDGRSHAYVDVETESGKRVKHCRLAEGELRSRKLLGLPIGIDGLYVTCVDGAGREHSGRAVMRSLRR
jgi:hypothetical protein